MSKEKKVSFCGLTKGISPKICILCVRVKTNKRSFEPFCVKISVSGVKMDTHTCTYTGVKLMWTDTRLRTQSSSTNTAAVMHCRMLCSAIQHRHPCQPSFHQEEEDWGVGGGGEREGQRE